MHAAPTRLIVVSAPSGAGKTTLCQRLLAEFPRLVLSISTTTRKPRGSEQHGREYFFVSREEFERQISEGKFAEWARVHDNYYGTSKSVIEKAFVTGNSVLLDIDVQGAEQLRSSYPRESVLIFVAPPSLDELERRLRSRNTDSEASIQKRMNNARAEMARKDSFDHVVVNDSLERAYSELRGIVARNLEPASGRA